MYDMNSKYMRLRELRICADAFDDNIVGHCSKEEQS